MPRPTKPARNLLLTAIDLQPLLPHWQLLLAHPWLVMDELEVKYIQLLTFQSLADLTLN